MVHKITTQYLTDVFNVDRYNQMILKAIEKINGFKYNNPFDAIAFTGVSGAALAFPLGFMTETPLICVRKDNEKSHHKGNYEGALCDRFIIVDDFIGEGDTINRICRVVSQESKATCVGIFLFDSYYDAEITVWTGYFEETIPVISIWNERKSNYV